jgi:hypothetical protein
MTEPMKCFLLVKLSHLIKVGLILINLLISKSRTKVIIKNIFNLRNLCENNSN